MTDNELQQIDDALSEECKWRLYRLWHAKGFRIASADITLRKLVKINPAPPAIVWPPPVAAVEAENDWMGVAF